MLALCLLSGNHRCRILHILILSFFHRILIWHGLYDYLLDWLCYCLCSEGFALAAVLMNDDEEDGGG